jgi:glutathione S-transferase
MSATYSLTRWAPQDRSGKVNWLLNELEVPFEIRQLEHKVHHNDPEYRKQQPLGRVPVLEDRERGLSLFESGAISVYLADKHSAKNFLLKDKPVEYAACLQWIFFSCAEIDRQVEAYWDIDDEAPDAAAKKAAQEKRIFDTVAPIERRLAASEWLAGPRLSVADIVVAQNLHYLRRLPFMGELPQIRAYMERLKARPAAKKSGLFEEPSAG